VEAGKRKFCHPGDHVHGCGPRSHAKRWPLGGVRKSLRRLKVFSPGIARARRTYPLALCTEERVVRRSAARYLAGLQPGSSVLERKGQGEQAAGQELAAQAL
jgi:hypothetical protein